MCAPFCRQRTSLHAAGNTRKLPAISQVLTLKKGTNPLHCSVNREMLCFHWLETVMEAHSRAVLCSSDGFKAPQMQ